MEGLVRGSHGRAGAGVGADGPWGPTGCLLGGLESWGGAASLEEGVGESASLGAVGGTHRGRLTVWLPE